MTVGDWAQIAGATGTLAAVVVALFGRQLQRILVPPRLDLRLEDRRGAEAKEVIAEGEGRRYIPCRYFHLRVSNPHRWSPITAVRVFLLGIERRGADGAYASLWQGEVPIQWRFPDQVPPALDIGFPRDCDLCSVASDKTVRLKPTIPWALEGLYTFTASSALRLTLRARGLEGDSGCVSVELDWDGSWPLASSFSIRQR